MTKLIVILAELIGILAVLVGTIGLAAILFYFMLDR